MRNAIKIAIPRVSMTFWVIPLCASSTPPLTPMANNRYNDKIWGWAVVSQDLI